MPLSSSLGSSPPEASTSSSARRSHKLYSRRSQIIARKRKAALDAESSTDESEGEGSIEKSMKGMTANKRGRQNSASPVPRAARSMADDIAPNRDLRLAAPSTPPRQSKKSESITPLSSPRDLSSLFSPTPRSPSHDSPTNQKRPGGMRRMLTKAQSLGDTVYTSKSTTPAPSTPSRATRTQSMPESPLAEASPGLERPPSALEPDAASKARRTYGGTRSFLEAMSTEVMEEDIEDRRTYAELRGRFEVDSGDTRVNLLPDLLQARPPQPVSDMRSKGENRRFMDEVGYIIDGLSDTTLAIKRASSLEMISSMMDEEWAAKMHVCGQSERLWEALSANRQDDEIIEAISLLFLVMCASTPIGLDAILLKYPEDCVALCLRATRRDGPLETVSRASTPMAVKVRHFCESLFPGIALVQQVTLRGWSSWLLTIVGSRIPARSGAFRWLMRTIADEQGVGYDMNHVNYCLQTILILVRADEDLHMFAEKHVVLDLLGFVTRTVAILRKEHNAIAVHCLISLLQLIVYFSSTSPDWAADVGLDELLALAWVISHREPLSITLGAASTEEQLDTDEDLLCLALSVVITIAENNVGAERLTRLEIDRPSEAGHVLMPVLCAEIYLRYSEDVSESGPIVRGYLALLLARALVVRPDQRNKLLRTISIGEEDRALRRICDSLCELEEMHREVRHNLKGGLEGEEGLSRIIQDVEEMMRQ